jgi:hypothetical protein
LETSGNDPTFLILFMLDGSAGDFPGYLAGGGQAITICLPLTYHTEYSGYPESRKKTG